MKDFLRVIFLVLPLIWFIFLFISYRRFQIEYRKLNIDNDGMSHTEISEKIKEYQSKYMIKIRISILILMILVISLSICSSFW
jgi:hypothetical protein